MTATRTTAAGPAAQAVELLAEAREAWQQLRRLGAETNDRLRPLQERVAAAQQEWRRAQDIADQKRKDLQAAQAAVDQAKASAEHREARLRAQLAAAAQPWQERLWRPLQRQHYAALDVAVRPGTDASAVAARAAEVLKCRRELDELSGADPATWARRLNAIAERAGVELDDEDQP
jgi:DNA repair exonuclease SbcCD ATPase subunit